MPRRKALDDAAKLAPGLAKRPESVQRDRREDEQGRTWDERHKAVSLRLREQDADRLACKAEELELSKDALGAALMWAALDALDAGNLTLEIETMQTEVTDKKGRQRTYVRKRARAAGQIPPFPARGDSGE
jgi:hypothetical protein